ncbi:MAG: hypothetical protein DRQ89_13350 [Epsilonproteobacteria bacterium]|nr:MAG: hypothetical protein DRQ89_13350 [Campylobacterota bacterium]
MIETTIGKYLKEKRTAKKISLEMISKKTKITTRQLDNLEKDRFDLLPNKAYVVGYIKSYAKILDEDTQELLNLFEETYHPPTQDSEDLKYFPRQEEGKSKAILKIAVSGTLVLAVSVWAIIFFYNKTQTKLTELKTITPQEITAETPLQVETKEITPPEEITVIEVKEEPVVELPKEEKKKQTFYKITKTLYSFKKDKVKETIDKYLPTKYQNSVMPHKQNIFINAVYNDTWLTYKADDGAIRKFVLQKGRSILIRGKLIRIFLGNVKAAEIFLNNRPLTIDSRTGVKSLIFPQEKKTDYKLPLFVFKDDGSVITSDEFN